MESVPCNLCGSIKNSTIYQLPDLLLDKTDEVFTLVRCNQCGLIYQNPRPDQASIQRYYPQDYEPYYQEGSKNWLMRKVNQSGVDKRCRMIGSLQLSGKGRRLLDIGCSTGLFIHKLQQTKLWEVWGVETSEFAVKIAKEQYQLDIYQGDLFQANFQESFFDVVTLWDVLEHLPDPSRTIKEISRITLPNGYIVLRVPNYDSFDSKLFGAAWAGLDLPRHYYVFSKPNLVKLLNQNGYDVHKISGNIGAYPTFLLSLRFWLTKRSVNKSSRQKIMGILNHPISALISSPIFYFYGLFLLGTEITLIAQKSTNK